MTGSILSVNLSISKGEKKTPVGSGMLVKDVGLAHDAHAGGGNRQLSLLSHESIKKIIALGLSVGNGDFAENITTWGIELHTLPVGTQLRIGHEAVIRISQIGKECHERCNIYYQIGDCVMPREGIFAEVICGGEIKANDKIQIIGPRL